MLFTKLERFPTLSAGLHSENRERGGKPIETEVLKPGTLGASKLLETSSAMG